METSAREMYQRIPKTFPEVSAIGAAPATDPTQELPGDPEAELLDAFMRVRQDEEDELEGLEPEDEAETAAIGMTPHKVERGSAMGSEPVPVDLLDVVRDQQVGSVYLEEDLSNLNLDWQCSAIEAGPDRTRERLQKLSAMVPPHGLRHGHFFAGTVFICVTSSALTLLLGWHPTAFVIVMCWLIAASAFMWFYCRRLIILALSWCEGDVDQFDEADMAEVAAVDNLNVREWPTFVSTDASEDGEADTPSDKEEAEIEDAVKDFIAKAQANTVEVAEVEHPVNLEEIYPNRPKPRNVNILVAPDDTSFFMIS